jgi:hypothetical protein
MTSARLQVQSSRSARRRSCLAWIGRAKATGRRWYSGDGGCWLWKAVEAARPELGLGQMFWCGYESIRTRQADILLRR